MPLESINYYTTDNFCYLLTYFVRFDISLKFSFHDCLGEILEALDFLAKLLLIAGLNGN